MIPRKISAVPCWPNLFDKPNEQSQACLSSAMREKVGVSPIRLDLIFRTNLKRKTLKTGYRGLRSTALSGHNPEVSLKVRIFFVGHRDRASLFSWFFLL